MTEEQLQKYLEDYLKEQPEILDWAILPLTAGVKAPSSDRLDEWLKKGAHGQMDFMAKTALERKEPKSFEAEAQSMVLFLWKYPRALRKYNPQSVKPFVASYAQGEDYHRVIFRFIHNLRTEILQRDSEIQIRPFADSSPVFERDWAAEIGLGWRAKNTCLIHKKWGSGFFIGGFFIDRILEKPFTPAINFCGSCTQCIDACPTQALSEGFLDARKCISYQTIEMAGPFGDSAVKEHGEWIMGCDICQQVCPWNLKHLEKADNQESHSFDLDLEEWLSLLKQGGGFKSRFGKSPLMRAGRKKLLRNVFRFAVSQNRVDLKEKMIELVESEVDEVLKTNLLNLLSQFDPVWP